MNEKQKKELLDVKTYGNLGDNFHCKIEELELLINKFISQAKQEEREKNISDIQGCIVNSEDWDELILDYGYINELLTDRYNKGKEEGFELGWKGAGGDIKDGVKITISNPTNSDILKALKII